MALVSTTMSYQTLVALFGGAAGATQTLNAEAFMAGLHKVFLVSGILSAIRGNATYVDPRTGASQQLPYYSAPGQVHNSGGNYYTQDQQGAYYQWNGNAWIEASLQNFQEPQNGEKPAG